MNLFLFKIYQLIKFKKKKFTTNPNKLFKFLNEAQYWSKDKLHEYQLKKLNDLLLLSKESSVYYSNKFANINLPLKTITDFNNLIPLISKNEIIENFNELRTKKFTNRFEHATSGTTGNPMTIFISGQSEALRMAKHNRFHNWWGIKENDKNVYIAITKSNKQNSLYTKIAKHLRRRHDIDVFDLNENTILKYFNEIEMFRPAYIRGYKSALLELAQLMDLFNLRFTNFKLKVAIVTSEVLYDNERKYIENILECKLANEYGSVEAGIYAYECPSGSMHINEESVYISTNYKNEAIVTELDNDSMPLINYKNDDVLIISKDYCKCGRSSRVISEIKGRVTGYITRPDGSKINQIIINLILLQLNKKNEFKNTIKIFQVIQRQNEFLVKIVPLKNFKKESQKYIRKRLIEEIGESIDIKFDVVSDLDRDKSGKLRIFIDES